MKVLPLLGLWSLSGCFIGKEVYERRMADFTDDDGDGYHEEDGDCNDLDPAFSPGAVEVCDNRDENCDGIIDNDAIDAPLWYPDADGDGVGSLEGAVRSCEPPDGSWLRDSGDCDDDDASVVVHVWYLDEDGDGYGVEEVTFSSCEQPDGTSDTPGDCDDQLSWVNPGEEEFCLDGVDNDCDGEDECRWPDTVSLSDYVTISPLFDRDNLGYSGTVGDVDGDGEPELLVGTPYAYTPEVDRRTGSLSIFKTPLTEGKTRDEAEYFFTGTGELDSIGTDVTLVDLDRDGYEDLIVGAAAAPLDDVLYTGEVHVLYGPVTAGGNIHERADWNIIGSIPEGDFGDKVRNIGDFDGDDRDDFAVGGRLASAGDYNFNGSAYIFTAAGTGATRATHADVLSVIGSGDGHEVGRALCGIDLEGDGLTDFMVSANQGMRGDGELYLFEHDSMGELTRDDADETWQGERGTFGGWQMDNGGDLNGDGVEDLVATSLDKGGTIYIIWGHAGI
ncbi:MAG: MopE-related protein, partial [Myxococcota bacterium]